MAKRTTTKNPAARKISDAHAEARLRARTLRAHEALERSITQATMRLTRLVKQRDDSLQRLAEFLVERAGTHRLVWRDQAATEGS